MRGPERRRQTRASHLPRVVPDNERDLVPGREVNLLELLALEFASVRDGGIGTVVVGGRVAIGCVKEGSGPDILGGRHGGRGGRRCSSVVRKR